MGAGATIGSCRDLRVTPSRVYSGRLIEVTIHVIARAFQWRGESVLARVALGAQREEHGVEGGVEPEPPRWKLLRGNGEVFVGPEYCPGEEVWPGWDGAKARFEEALDVEVDVESLEVLCRPRRDMPQPAE